MPEYYKPSEIAELLNISVRKVRELITSGKLPAIKIGKVYRVRKDDLDEFIEKGRVKSDDAN